MFKQIDKLPEFFYRMVFIVVKLRRAMINTLFEFNERATSTYSIAEREGGGGYYYPHSQA